MSQVFVAGYHLVSIAICCTLWTSQSCATLKISCDEYGWVDVACYQLMRHVLWKLSYYQIWKRYYENNSSPDLKKIVVTFEGFFKQVHAYFSVNYESNYIFMQTSNWIRRTLL